MLHFTILDNCLIPYPHLTPPPTLTSPHPLPSLDPLDNNSNPSLNFESKIYFDLQKRF